MDFFNGNRPKLSLLVSFIAGIAIAAAALNLSFTRRTLDRCWESISKMWATAGSAPEAAGSPGPGATPLSAPDADALAQAQSTVEGYMRIRASPQCTLSFLNWTDFSTADQMSWVTLRYRVQQPSREDVLASVKFTIQAGNVIKAEIIDPGLQAATPLAAQPARTPARPAVVIDRFSAPLFAAMHGPSMTLELNSAYSLAQLEQAKETAQAERKPLGFIMVWGQFFDHEADPQSRGSDSALVHFYEAFHDQLVLVFVRHESELGLVPHAVSRGFASSQEGGYAPNMAVVDATATEFIVEIPFRNLDGPGRDQLFAAGGRKIDQWLATHPNAMATPPAGNP
jgi:hypothetical protein